MHTIFSDKEQTIRRWWLRIFLFSSVYSCFTFIATPENHVLVGYLALGIDFLMKIAIYYFGFLRKGTRWLTTSIGLSAFGFSFLFLLLLGALIGNGNFIATIASGFWASTLKIGLVRFMIGNLIAVAYFYANIQLRKMNKIRKPQKITIISA